MIKPTKEQASVIEQVIHWYYTYTSNDPIFVINGYAGTGKSTIIEIIVKLLGLLTYNVLFTTFAGKASNVLRIKGHNANTIHKTFYRIIKHGSKFRFSLKKSIPYYINLIVIDEFSMVSDKYIADILSFNIPIIALGDPGQLPPIFGINRFIHNKRWPILKNIMRQTDKSGILELADLARNGIDIPWGSYKKSKVISINDDYKLSDYDVVICWRNKTRNMLNNVIREELGFYDQFPTYGEKIICLHNNYTYMIEKNEIPFFIVNGLVCNVESYSRVRDDKTIMLKFKPNFFSKKDKSYYAICYSEPFIHGIDPLQEDYNEQYVHIDFGYALTCHKSQGSEWDNVLVIDEHPDSDNLYNKWLYTAITRAKKKVTIIR